MTNERINEKANRGSMLSIRNNNQGVKQTIPITIMESGMKRLELMKSEVKQGEKRKVENFKSHSLSQSWDISFGDRKLDVSHCSAN